MPLIVIRIADRWCSLKMSELQIVSFYVLKREARHATGLARHSGYTARSRSEQSGERHTVQQQYSTYLQRACCYYRNSQYCRASHLYTRAEHQGRWQCAPHRLREYTHQHHHYVIREQVPDKLRTHGSSADWVLPMCRVRP